MWKWKMASTALKTGYSHESVCSHCQKSGRSLAGSELELNHVVSTVWGVAKGRRLEQSLFCRAGHCFSSLMWFIASSQGRRINLELTAHQFVIRAPVMQASLLQSSACFHAARLPLEHTLQGCLHPEREGMRHRQVWCGEESKTTPVAQFLLPLCVPWFSET